VIDVRYEADHEVPMMRAGVPMLTWRRHLIHGNGWTLSYLEDDSETAGLDDLFIPGDLVDVDYAVAKANQWIDLVESRRDG